MTVKYHLTPTGDVRPCKANKRACRYGEEQHFSTQAEAETFLAKDYEAAPSAMRKEERLHIDPYDEQISELLKTAPTYQKVAPVRMRVSIADEVLETVLADGTVETTQRLDAGKAIVANPMGEEYAMSMDKFLGKYEQSSDDPEVWVPNATARIKAVPNPFGRPISLDASWGEVQVGDGRCLIAENRDGSRYIIGADELDSTYIEV